MSSTVSRVSGIFETIKKLALDVWESNNPLEIFVGKAFYGPDGIVSLIITIENKNVDILPFVEWMAWKMHPQFKRTGSTKSTVKPAKRTCYVASGSFNPVEHSHKHLAAGNIKFSSEYKPSLVMVIKTQKPVTYIVLGSVV
jgi:hypothetical protein